MEPNEVIFDIEADGLEPTKIHCLSYAMKVDDEWVLNSTTSYDEMREFFSMGHTLIGHNIIRWDIPNVERLLEIKIGGEVVDTLGISWYLYPKRLRHGLEFWGEDFGVPKPKIDDWENQTIEEYIHRCEEDVKINTKLWCKIKKDLVSLYGDESSYWRLIKYLMFKLDCAREAERSRWKLDVEKCEQYLNELEEDKLQKIVNLRKAMPPVPIIKTVSYPAKPYKANGELSTRGKKWIDLLHEYKLENTHREDIEILKGYKEANPNSVPQIKDWLLSLGWKPITFDYKKKKDDSGKTYTDNIPQIRKEVKGEKLLCDSVRRLVDKEPAIEHLEGLTILTHRIGILKGYLKNVDEEGYLQARISGLTNTLRFKHSVIVNLPGVGKPYGKYVRGVLIAPEGYELCGSDMSSLEDRVKQHYMWDFDPDYVREMQTEGWDPHLNLAEFAGALTPEQVQNHKDGTENHSRVRHLYKQANYSCTYGSGGKKLALTLDIPIKEGQSIVDAYRGKNWAIDKIAESCKTKTIGSQKWLYNPISRFWYSLRHDKDKFSTLNQGSGVFCFDVWIKNFRAVRSQITGQYHDECILTIKKGNREQCTRLLRDAIDKTNKQLKLNRELDIDIQFGDNYAEIH